MDNKTLNPSVEESIRFIRENVSKEDIYLQLAEEAAELAKAASKMARVAIGSNPTPVGERQAFQDLIEEYTDVLNVAENILMMKPDQLIADYKLYRWRKRLEKKQEKKSEFCCDSCRIE